MIINFRIVLVLGLFMTGCVDKPIIETTDTSPTPTPHPIEITATATPLVTLSETAPVPTTKITEPVISPIPFPLTPTNIITPQVVNICPEKNNIALDDFELPSNEALLVFPEDITRGQFSSSPFMVSNHHPNPKLMQFIPETTSEGYRRYQVSPDGNWVMSSVRQADNDQQELWINSIDGIEQKHLLTTSKLNYARWISNDEIILIGSPNTEGYEELETYMYMPFFIINPFTLEQRNLTYIAGDRLSGRFFDDVFSHNENPYTLYSEGKLSGVEYNLYDYQSDKNLPVFQWLKQFDPIALSLDEVPVWIYDGDKFAVTVKSPGGIDYAFDLNIDTSRENLPFHEAMTRAILPEDLLPALVLGVEPINNIIIMKRFDPNTIGKSTELYTLNVTNGVLTKYCHEINGVIAQREFSADGRYFAFTLETDWQNPPIKSLVGILDLTTGVFSYFPDYALIDWSTNIE